MNLPFDIDLKDKVVVVTGAGGVLCSMFAEAMSKTGAKVALLDLNEDAAKGFADKIKSDGGCAKAYGCNVLDKSSLEAAHKKVLADFTINNGITHSQNLVPIIEQAQKFAGVELSDIDAFACSIGPGSFTGLRIGIATIKGFALSINKPVLAIPTLLALAYNTSNFDGLICSIIDARNDNVYAGIYRNDEDSLVLAEDYISDNIEILIEHLKNYDDNIVFIGDGVSVYKDLLLKKLQSDSLNIAFAPEHLNCQYALSVARAAYDKATNNEYDDYNSLSPLYLKKSQADRELEEKNKKL